jgi:CRISPR-associated protein Csm1
MSEQILVQGKLLGIDAFLASPGSDEILAARSLWITLICEVAPRALLQELELARLLLGSSGGGQFLIVIPDTHRAQAVDFLSQVASRIDRVTAGKVRLIWGITENLGDWTVVRKRLNEELDARRNTPLASGWSFAPFVAPADVDTYFTAELAQKLREAQTINWSADCETIVTCGPGKHTWNLTPNLSLEGISLARHAAPGEESGTAATTSELAARSQGRPLWGVLRGDVDHFAVRLRRLASIEEHVQLSMLYKQFFAGELEVLCSMPEFWRKVTILYSGGNDFAVYGSWNALIPLARELQRMFQRFAEENLKEFPGAEAKTITMACTLAQSGAESGAETVEAGLPEVYERCGRDLRLAKAADKDCIFVMDRVLEWKQLSDAAEVKEAVERINEEYRGGRQFLAEVLDLYEKVTSPLQKNQEKLLRRAYRFQRKFGSDARSKREREFQKLRTHLIGEIVGRNVKPAKGKQLKLRPAGAVALELTRLEQEV